MVGGDTAEDRVWGPRSAYITPCEICERLTIHCGEYSVECHLKYTATQKQQTQCHSTKEAAAGVD